jgi:hypothetical protein
MIRRFFTRVLLVMLIAACGYNWLQTQRLRAQVTQLQSQQHRASVTGDAKTQTPEARLSLSVLQARWKHLRNQANAFRSTSKKVFHELPI